MPKLPRLREIRELRAMTQTELAAAAGVQQPNLSRIERGEVSAQARTHRRLASALGVKPEELLREAEASRPLPPRPLPPHVEAEVQRILDAAARRLLKEELDRATGEGRPEADRG